MNRPKTLEERRAEFRAEFLAELRELRQRQEAEAWAAKQPKRRIVEREVQVAPSDPNWSAANAGIVRVNCEQLYWQTVDREFGPRRPATVVSEYHPWEGKR
jgi:hypothetical protein